ncbi:MAG: hypothetical protein PHR87_11990 [Sulfurospirillaceae bacterium]|nr:hypothetical protein [Sulfurospirillaceae bacterium]
MENWIFRLVVSYLILLIPLSIYIDDKIQKYQFSNKYFNIFLVLSSIFAHPITIVIAFLVSSQYFVGLTEFDCGITTFPRIVLFMMIAIFLSFMRFIVWIYIMKQPISYLSLFVFSKQFAFLMPFLVFTPGFFTYVGQEFTVPTFSLLIFILAIGYSLVIAFIKHLFGGSTNTTLNRG